MNYFFCLEFSSLVPILYIKSSKPHKGRLYPKGNFFFFLCGRLRLDQTVFCFVLFFSYLFLDDLTDLYLSSHSSMIEIFEQVNFRPNFKFQLETILVSKPCPLFTKKLLKTKALFKNVLKAAITLIFHLVSCSLFAIMSHFIHIFEVV